MALRSGQNESSNQLMRRPPSGNVSYQSSYPEDEDAKLERKALEAKVAAQRSRKAIPPFVQKLSSFLDESRNTDLIRWSENGDSFIVLDEDEFARTMIPELFKHNNYASFVRQLNMYGFHKRVGLSDNSMRASERKNKTPSEYSNPYFKRGRPLLLWLIQKPKSAPSKVKSGKAKEGDTEDDVDETFDVETVQADTDANDTGGQSLRGPSQPLMIGDGQTGLPPTELQAVNNQLRQIRQQQVMITNMIQKIRQEHDQLYNQAAAFTEVNTRHENSINAILTFLATIYNRSLEGQSDKSAANRFTSALPGVLQQQGNIVDVGDFNGQGVEVPGITRRSSRKQLLLGAPPDAGSRGQNTSANSNQKLANRSSSNRFSQMNNANAFSPVGGQVEEIYDPDTPNTNANVRSPMGGNGTNHDFMSLINSANARDGSVPKNSTDFTEVLSHLQNADGQSPLSPQQRDNALQQLANSNGSNNSNALLFPSPPNLPNLDNWNSTDQNLQYLERTLKDQESKVNDIANKLQPLSPSGSIPGLDDSQYIPPPDNLNLDDYFNFDTAAGTDFGDGSGFNFGNDGAAFDNSNELGYDNTQEEPMGLQWNTGHENDQTGRVVETGSSSDATSPANTVEDGQTQTQNPRKRRRRN